MSTKSVFIIAVALVIF